MAEYRIGFEAISPKSIEDLSKVFYETFDGALSNREGTLHATVYIEGASGIDAATTAIHALEHMGFSVCRVDRDLVDGPEIAERLDVTRQAVQGWATGARRSSFPHPVGYPGGKRVWTWSQIVDWARRERDFDEAPGLTLDEIAVVDAELARRRMHVTSQAPAAVSTSLMTLSGGLKPHAGYLSTGDYTPGRTVVSASR